MDTASNIDLKYFPEDELENIIAEVRKKRQQKWENHIASKSFALGSSNVDQMMEIFQSERKNQNFVADDNCTKETQRTEFCQCLDNGCECIQKKCTKDNDCDEKCTPTEEAKEPNKDISKLHALLVPEEILFRLRNILKRLVTSLEQFKKHITKQNPKAKDEEVEENERKMKRANEFVSWFSRNYLYQLKRQLDLLKNEKSSKFEDLYKKLYLSFQTTVQAIQACLKTTAHSSIAPCKKIDEFLKETVALYDYCIDELKPSVELERIKSLTNEACNLLEEHVEAQNKAEVAAAIRTKSQHKKRNVKQPKTNVPKKLSMYCSSSLPKECWEKKSLKLAMKKFGPPKSKNAAGKSSKVSPKPSERSLGKKDEKLPARGSGKDDDLAIPLLLPCDSKKRFELFLLANTMTELENLRGKMDKEDCADNCSNEETVKETLQKIAKQINEIYKSSSDLNENQLEKKEAPEENIDVANSKLICIKHDENYQKKPKKIECNKNEIISEDGKSFCIPFCVDEETIESCKRYKSEFEEYKSSLCCDPEGFSNLVERSADIVILKLIDSIAEEMEEGMTLLTNKLYELELKEVCS